MLIGKPLRIRELWGELLDLEDPGVWGRQLSKGLVVPVIIRNLLVSAQYTPSLMNIQFWQMFDDTSL